MIHRFNRNSPNEIPCISQQATGFGHEASSISPRRARLKVTSRVACSGAEPYNPYHYGIDIIIILYMIALSDML